VTHGKVTYVQIAPTTRADVPEYVHIREELEGIAGSINGKYSEFDWTPLRYINRSFSRAALAGIFRLSRVGLVTPLRDGMNLVAKEFVVAQSAQNPGVLVLSRFAGAAHHMAGALIVNPYDVQGVADALPTALNMPLDGAQESLGDAGKARAPEQRRALARELPRKVEVRDGLDAWQES